MERSIALRYLKAKRRNNLVSLISVLAVGGVGLGVAALIVVLAVLAGFETNLKMKLLGLQPHVTIYKPSSNIANWREVAAIIKTVPEVVQVQPMVSGQVMVASPGGASGVVILGIDPTMARDAKLFEQMNLTPHGLDNLTQRPMVPPYPIPDDADLYFPSDNSSLEEDEDAFQGDTSQTEEVSEEDSLILETDLLGAESLLSAPLIQDDYPNPPGPLSPGESPLPEEGSAEIEVPSNLEPRELQGLQTGTGQQGADLGKDRELPATVNYPPGIIIGSELSYNIGQGVLGELNVISPFGTVTPIGKRIPLSRIFQVAGVFSTNFYDFDSRMAFTTIENAQSLLGMDDSVSLIEIMVEDIYRADKVRRDIVQRLGGYEFFGRDWMQMNLSLFSALKLEQTAMFVILTLIILVAAFNIASTLVMMVTEKTRDIAILKAMGATSGQVRKIFTIQGLVVGALGTFGGLIVGLTLCFLLKRYEFISLPQEVYLMSTLPVEVRPLQVITIILVSLLISYLATLYPASQAASMDPVEAIRYE
ncbi:MAG: ABC transporter permease [Deltaproteobacteria bacterium]|nr:ABC transporter permease [Deltaproteobacteria bacterium]